MCDETRSPREIAFLVHNSCGTLPESAFSWQRDGKPFDNSLTGSAARRSRTDGYDKESWPWLGQVAEFARAQSTAKI